MAGSVLSDPDLAKKQSDIHAWTIGRVTAVLRHLEQLPGARKRVDVPGLAHVVDSFFWSLLAQATLTSRADLNQFLDAATHIIYHAMFSDSPGCPDRTKEATARVTQITRADTANRLRSPLTQDVQQSDAPKDMADPGCGADNLQQATSLSRHVVGTDQFAHASCVDARHSSQIQHDDALAKSEESPDGVPQLPIHRREKRAFE